MNAITETQPIEPERRSGKASVIGPAALALGGALSLVWAYALGLAAYDIVCWFFA